MSAKFTPGPWEVWPEVHGSHPDHLVYINVGPKDKRRVASTGVYGYRRGSNQITSKRPVVPEDECRANARLIAAAPNLLAELEWTINTLEKFYDPVAAKSDVTMEAVGERIASARAAIAKAEGRTP